MAPTRAPDPGPLPAPRRGKDTQGETLPQRHLQPEPQLPHERDGASDSHPGTDDPRIAQAAKDVSRGLVDTGLKPVIHELQGKHFPTSPKSNPKR